jgi:serine/threonine protein kinase
MAPEQKRGEIDQIDQRTDVYALGAILSFLLTGKSKVGLAQKESPLSTANTSASPTLLNAKIPKSLTAICAKATAEEKTQRYASAFDLANDIERFLNGLAVSSYKENIFEKIWRWLKQYRFIVLLVLIYLLVRILLIILLRP